MTWYLAEKILECSAQNSTWIGRMIVFPLLLLRISIISIIGESIYSDEQTAFTCNQNQPGCKINCFNTYSNFSFIRFCSLRMIMTTLPPALFIIYVGFLVMSNQYLNRQHNQPVTSIFQLSINKLKLTRIIKQKRFFEMDRAQARIAKKKIGYRKGNFTKANHRQIQKNREIIDENLLLHVSCESFFSKHNADLESPLRDIDFVLERTNFSKFYIFRFCRGCFINHQMPFSPEGSYCYFLNNYGYAKRPGCLIRAVEANPNKKTGS